MNYRLLAVDIDGTLLNSKGELTQNTREYIYKALDRGVVFVICTGRPIQGVTGLNDEIGIDLPYITYNGAMVVKGNSREIIYEKSLSAKDARKVFDFGVKCDTTMVIWSDNKLYVNKDNEKARNYSSLVNTPFIKIDDLSEINSDITKILWYDDNKKLIQYQNEFYEMSDEDIICHFSRPYFLEFVDRYATKAIAINKLCELYGFDISETIAVGDGYNDLSMIKSAGLGVAMDNAPDDIKKEAKFITKSCDDEGVAYVIKKFILEE